MWRLWEWLRGERSPDRGPERGDSAIGKEPHHTVNASISAKSEARIISPMFVNSVVHGSVSITEASNVPGNLPDPEAIRKVIEDHKRQMLERYGTVFEGLVQREHKTSLTTIYTPLYIIAGESEEVNSDHEIWQIETANRKQKRQYVQISINDIFGEQACKRVMTKGVAGVGKTVSVQKFIMDWAEGNANQDLDFVICLPFRELNLLSGEKSSLLQLMLDFNSTLRPLEGIDFEKHKVLFILDGLDECRFPLNFKENKPVFRITEDASLDVLLTNLLKGQLLQSARVWITTRPAAAAVVPSTHIDRFTEVRGFNDEQKGEYFRNKFGDGPKTEKIIRHVKTTRSLYIMCHIPVFCCITATVLKTMLDQRHTGEIPKTLTEMYTCFLYTQLSMSNQKFIHDNIRDRKAFLAQNKEAILKLAELAFRKLEGEGGSILFYEDDLKECGIDLTEASVLCGLCTEIFRVEPVMFEKRYYSFVHLSIQEFLAALHIFASFLKRDMQALRPFLKFKPKKMFLYLLLKNVIDKALKSENGHLDLFVRFLLGLCLDTNHHLLDGLLPDPVDKDTEDYNKSIVETKRHIKNLVHKNLSPERFINLMNCLTELKDSSVHKEMQRYLQYSSNPQTELEPSHCSALANMVLLSDEPLEELDFQRYNLGDGDEAKERLVPAVRWCKKARLFECKLLDHCGEILASALQSDHSPLRQLELKKCPLTEEGLRKLCSALNSPQCKLQALSLAGSRRTSDFMCEVLGEALSSSSPHLTELNLSRNMLCSEDVRDITNALKKTSCGVNTLRLQKCNIKEHGCELLAGILRSEHGNLMELDLRENALSYCAVAQLSEALKTPQCKLQTLRLSATDIREEASWMCLASAFRGQLDLSESRLTEAQLKQLSTALRSPDCSLKTLRLRQCFLKEGHCAVLASVLSSDRCHLVELDLTDNDLQDSGVELLSSGLRSFHCTLQTLRLSFCGVTERGCEYLASALSSNPSHLRELDLSYNYPGDIGVQLISQRKDDPTCTLTTINVENSAECWMKSALRKYAQEVTLDKNTMHKQLDLKDGDRKVCCSFTEHDHPPQPQRFAGIEQVLATEGFRQRCYWEAEWAGFRVYLGMTHRGVERHGDRGRLGHNNASWALRCYNADDDYENSYTAFHDDQGTAIASPGCALRRVGVFLDWDVGTLSFYAVSEDTLVHLHTFHHRFEEDLVPGVLFVSDIHTEDSVLLCKVE